jgi:hypothetical protein
LPPEAGGPPPAEGEALPPEAGGPLPAEDESALLAEPAKRNDDITGDLVRTRYGTAAYVPANRDDGAYLTPGAKGKHYVPKRDDEREQAGRAKHMLGLTNWESGINTPRNTLKGFSDLSNLGRGIFENKQPNYSEEAEEKQLFEVNQESRKLIEALQRRDTNEEETQ